MTADDTQTIRDALDLICQDSLEIPLQKILDNREQSEREEVSALFLVVSDGLDRLAAENERLRAVANGLLWLNDNRHHYGSPRWLDYFDAAVVDARAALAGGVGDTAA